MRLSITSVHKRGDSSDPPWWEALKILAYAETQPTVTLIILHLSMIQFMIVDEVQKLLASVAMESKTVLPKAPAMSRKGVKS